MDGIMVAYHNTNEIFGFQYIPLSEMDICVFGNSDMAQRSFALAVRLYNVLLKEVTEKIKSSVHSSFLLSMLLLNFFLQKC